MRVFIDRQNLQRPDAIIGKDEVSSSNLDSSSIDIGKSLEGKSLRGIFLFALFSPSYALG